MRIKLLQVFGAGRMHRPKLPIKFTAAEKWTLPVMKCCVYFAVKSPAC
jgi:hypothetical protein